MIINLTKYLYILYVFILTTFYIPSFFTIHTLIKYEEFVIGSTMVTISS